MGNTPSKSDTTSETPKKARVGLVTLSKICSMHPMSEIKLVCRTCNDKSICFHCLSTGYHYNHDCTELKKYVYLKRKSLVTLSQKREIIMKSDIKWATEMKSEIESKARSSSETKKALDQFNYYISNAHDHLENLVKCREKAEVDFTNMLDSEIIDVYNRLTNCLEKIDLQPKFEYDLIHFLDDLKLEHPEQIYTGPTSSLKHQEQIYTGPKSSLEHQEQIYTGPKSSLEHQEQIYTGPKSSLEHQEQIYTGPMSSHEHQEQIYTGPMSSLEYQEQLYIVPKSYLDHQEQTYLKQQTLLSSNEIRFMFSLTVHTIRPVSQNEAWIVHIVNNECQDNIKKVNMEGNIVDTVTLDTYISDVTTTPRGDVLVCCVSDGSVRKILNHASVILFRCEGCPIAISSSKDHVIISLRDQSVVKYNTAGHILNSSRKSRFKPGVLRPSKLAVCNKTGRVAVIDHEASWSVVVMDSNLNVDFTYEGETITKFGNLVPHWSCEPFTPNDVTFDSEGHLLVADAYDTVIMVGTDGHFLRILTVRQDHDLYAASLHESGKLWLGYKNGMIKILDI